MSHTLNVLWCRHFSPTRKRRSPELEAFPSEPPPRMGFPPIQPPLGMLPEHGQPYHAWWKEEKKQRNPYADGGPVRSARGMTPGARSNSTATTATKSSRRTASTGSSSRGSSTARKQYGQPPRKQFGGSHSARAATGPATGPHAQALQQRVNATLRELEEIKAGTHSVCIAPPRVAPRVVPVTPRRYVEPVVTARRAVPQPEPPAAPPSVPSASAVEQQPHHAVSNGDRLARRRGRAPAVAAPAPMMSSRRDATATAPEQSTRKAPMLTLEAVLTEAGLNQYDGVLSQHGMDVQGVLGSTAMQLQQLGMKMGHALRLLNTANRLQAGGEGRSAPASNTRQAPAVAAAAAGVAHGATREGEPWSEDEEDALLKARAIYGGRWDAIAGLLPGRSKDECRRHWEQSGSSSGGGRGDGIIARSSTSASTGVSSSVGAPTPMPMPPSQLVQPVQTGKVMDSGKKAAVQNELEAALAQLEAETGSEQAAVAGGSYGGYQSVAALGSGGSQVSSPAIVLCTSADAQMQQQWSAGLLVVALKLRPWGRRRQLLM